MSVLGAIQANRETAIRIAQRVGTTNTRGMLKDAETQLVERLRAMPPTGTFTEIRMRATLAQIRDVLRGLVLPGMRDLAIDGAEQAASVAATGTVDYLNAAERQYKGIGTQALALDESSIMDAATSGARASVLRRLASSGTPAEGADAEPHKARIGILQRYGMNVVGHFENILRTNLLTRSSFEDTRKQIVDASPFLQGAPASWSERIVRTETMGAYGRATFEATQEAHEQLGDLVKILCATFDNRTGSDSIACHGEIRRPNEPFETWFGLMQHPPNRPNDREIVVTHRQSWPIPPTLAWRPDGEIHARWKLEKRKGAAPPRPLMTTVDLGSFGRTR